MAETPNPSSAETLAPLTGTEPAPAAAPKTAAETLYPEGGATEGGTGEATVIGTDGADSVAGAPGADTVQGADTTTGAAPVELTSASYDALELPADLRVDDAAMKSFKDLALEAKLPPAEATKILGLLPGLLKQQADGMIAASNEQFKATRTAWQTESLALPELQGANKEVSLSKIGKALDEFGAPGVREALNITGAGDHPAVIATLLKMANALSEGTPTRTGSPRAQARRGPAETLYPNLVSRN